MAQVVQSPYAAVSDLFQSCVGTIMIYRRKYQSTLVSFRIWEEVPAFWRPGGVSPLDMLEVVNLLPP